MKISTPKPGHLALWTFTIISSWCLFQAFRGLGRPYDAVPDQDLLWLREALLMAQGKAPGYPDHPGAYWSISYTIKLHILSWIKAAEFSIGSPITPGNATLIIGASRLENGAIAAITAISLWPLLRHFKVTKAISAACVLAAGLSVGFMESISQIRNELTSSLFLIAYTIISLKLPESKNPRSYTFLSSASITLFLAAAYCKVQALILAPFFFSLILINPSLSEPTTKARNILKFLKQRTTKSHILLPLFILTSSVAPWILAVSGPIFAQQNRFTHARTEIDLPVWMLINLALAFIIILSATGECTWERLFNVAGINAITTAAIARIFAHPVWTAQVFSFPSNSLGFSQEGRSITAAYTGLTKYLDDIFAIPPLASILLFLALITTSLYTMLRTQRWKASAGDLKLAALGGSLILIWVANLMRVRGFYEVYLVLPTLIALAIGASQTLLRSKPAQKISLALLILCLTKSAANITASERYALFTQDRSFLCFEQAFDSTMSSTSINQCSGFNDFLERHSN